MTNNFKLSISIDDFCGRYIEPAAKVLRSILYPNKIIMGMFVYCNGERVGMFGTYSKNYVRHILNG